MDLLKIMNYFSLLKFFFIYLSIKLLAYEKNLNFLEENNETVIENSIFPNILVIIEEFFKTI